MALVKYNNNSLSAITSTAGMPAGAMTLIKSQTASSSATISFVDGTSDVVLDSTYPIYVFKFINIHPATDNVNFSVGFRDGSTDYDATKTTTFFNAQHKEDDSHTSLAYDTYGDLAQSTAFQVLQWNMGADNDQSCSGTLHLFNPSSTTFVKHFMFRGSRVHRDDYAIDEFVSGYCNVTAAIDGVQFKFSSGNMDAGTIKLYGIKDS
jgi:hypothetical protein